MIDNMEELQEALSDLLGDGFEVMKDDDGQIIIYTGLTENDDGELEEYLSDEDVEEDLDVDPDNETLDLEDDEE